MQLNDKVIVINVTINKDMTIKQVFNLLATLNQIGEIVKQHYDDTSYKWTVKFPEGNTMPYRESELREV